MTVKELRERLAEMPDWAEVVVEGRDWQTAAIDGVKETAGVVEISACVDLDGMEDYL